MWQVIVIDYICDVIAPCLLNTSVASPKTWGGEELGGGKMLDFRRITLSCLGYPLSRHKWLYVLKQWLPSFSVSCTI